MLGAGYLAGGPGGIHSGTLSLVQMRQPSNEFLVWIRIGDRESALAAIRFLVNPGTSH